MTRDPGRPVPGSRYHWGMEEKPRCTCPKVRSKHDWRLTTKRCPVHPGFRLMRRDGTKRWARTLEEVDRLLR